MVQLPERFHARNASYVLASTRLEAARAASAGVAEISSLRGSDEDMSEATMESVHDCGCQRRLSSTLAASLVAAELVCRRSLLDSDIDG